ncbi:glycine--tRNA ligase subunit beta [Shimazuella sp. AN120528]|uniref:glycine--tRNA ligase subunit beta n=1 Tax=Shimazuella soli TaxID=1892854 RepID=UPI001F105C9F|nr:glycine--tRNA ligase subunit beta [Shimazuella soli]
MKHSFLFEIGCEEIPARFVRNAAEQFSEKVEKWFSEQRISIGAVQTFATPRRLAVLVNEVAVKQSDRTELLRGPAAKIAKTEDGSWSKAAMGFARKNGVELSSLELKEDKGTEYVYAVKQEVGLHTEEVIANSFVSILESLTFPKTMRWEATRTKFIRPIRWLVSLLDNAVIPVSFAGITADRMTRGHRFLGKDIPLAEAGQYPAALRDQYVEVDMDARFASIRDQLIELQKENNWEIPIDEDLLEEVTQLVEYPTVVSGEFATEYLSLPKEVLITTMREHQRYFSVQDATGALLPYFVTIRNGDKHGLSYVSRGNEKVLRARLADAQFFFTEDKKLTIETAQRKLKNIVYQEALGSMAARVERGEKLALAFGKFLDLSEQERVQLSRAASIAKFDQATQIVSEFPELEGYMGREYAFLQGEEPAVAEALYEQVLPRHAEDQLPTSKIGVVLGLADRFDTLASGFGIGLAVSGSQDPYGFRKKAAAIIQLLVHYTNFPLSLTELIKHSVETVAETVTLKLSTEQLYEELMQFFRIRLKSYLLDLHVRYDVIEAVLKGEIGELYSLIQKTEVLGKLIEQNSFKLDVEGFTRVANLAEKADDRQVNATLFESEYEQRLFDTLKHAKERYILADRDETSKYHALASMVPVIHSFFDHVMVMVEEEKIRANRLALLRDINSLVQSFAAFEQIVFSGKES